MRKLGLGIDVGYLVQPGRGVGGAQICDRRGRHEFEIGFGDHLPAGVGRARLHVIAIMFLPQKTGRSGTDPVEQFSHLNQRYPIRGLRQAITAALASRRIDDARLAQDQHDFGQEIRWNLRCLR